MAYVKPKDIDNTYPHPTVEGAMVYEFDQFASDVTRHRLIRQVSMTTAGGGWITLICNPDRGTINIECFYNGPDVIETVNALHVEQAEWLEEYRRRDASKAA